MKQYVLESAPRSDDAFRPATEDAHEPGAAVGGGRWRTLGLLLLVEPLALGALYIALVGTPETSRVPATVHAAVVPPPNRLERDRAFVAQAQGRAAEVVPATPNVPRGRVTHERGAFAIDLRAVAPESAVSMLAKATGARVSGEQIFSGSALRLTHVSHAPSAREAWQAVFGEVASFAIACPRGTCEVRFVSLVEPALPAGVPAPQRLVEQRVQAVPGPAPVAAPAEPGRAPAAPPAAPPPHSEDPNAAEN